MSVACHVHCFYDHFEAFMGGFFGRASRRAGNLR